MLHVPEVVSEVDGDLPPLEIEEPPIPVVELVDRVAPRWVAIISTLFTVATSVCLLVIPVLALYFQAFPITEHGGLAASLTGLIGLMAIIGALVFDYVQMRALTGFRSLRERFANRAGLWLGALVASALVFVHPYLGLGPTLAAGIAFGCRTFWNKRPLHEPSWEYNRREAVSLLVGRDSLGIRIATATPNDHAFQQALLRGLTWGATLVTLAAASALASQVHLNAAAIPAMTLLALWATDAIVRGLLIRPGPAGIEQASTAKVIALPQTRTSDNESGCEVRDLRVQDLMGRTLLSDICFRIAPGSVVGVLGASGSGKSLLLRALQSPHDLSEAEVQGFARINARPLWTRSANAQSPSAVLLPEAPLLLPTSGLNNLTCFHADELRDRGLNLLEHLVFSVSDAEAICNAPDARRLPGQQRKLLSIARALLLSPPLYLMDRPEDGLDDRFVSALCDRIQQERKLGRCFLIVTENRALLDICDQLIVLQEGRMIDNGSAVEVRSKMSAGWARLVTVRSLDSEDNLVLWVRNLFKRPGDEGNRRAVGLLASEMLALSCQSNEGIAQTRVEFEFKHMKDHCLLRMIDDAPALSSAALTRAKKEVAKGADMTPLASILRATTDFNCSVENGRRVIEVKKDTYDPRSGHFGTA